MAELAIRLKPGSRRDALEYWERDREGREILVVSVRARPVDGSANSALIALLAQCVGEPVSRVVLKRGGRSRLKTVSFAGLDADALRTRLCGIAWRA